MTRRASFPQSRLPASIEKSVKLSVCDNELNTVESNEHNGLYMVDGRLRTRKDLQLVKGSVIPARKTTEAQKKKDKIGKTAYDPGIKDLMGARPTLKQVETMITEPRKSRGKQIDFRQLAGLSK